MKFIKAHPKFAAAVLVVFVAAGLLLYGERTKVMKYRQAYSFPNEARSEQTAWDTFYSDQLTKKELTAYELMKKRLEDLKGGVVELPEPLTGTEYIRVVSAIENQHDYFYGFYDIPMTSANVSLKYSDRDLTSVKNARISKALLFLSCANDVNQAGQYGADGTVENLREVNEAFSVNDPKKAAELEEKRVQTEGKVNEILAQLPKEAGEFEALTYFLDWMDENLSYYTELGQDAYSFTTMDEVFKQAYISNNPACILNGKATALGYTKLLSLLLKRAGIPSHIVLGTWGTYAQEGYVMCVAELSGENVYVDASGIKAASFSNIRCLREEEALAHIKPVSYFHYR